MSSIEQLDRHAYDSPAPADAADTPIAQPDPVPAREIVDALLDGLEAESRNVLLPGEQLFARTVLGSARRCQRLLNWGWGSSAPALAPLVETPVTRWLEVARAQAAAPPAPVTFAEHEARLLPLAWGAAMSAVTAYASILGWACMPALMVIALYAAL